MTDLIDLHTHTLASGHAYNTLMEMIRAAADKGLALYGCADHAPSMPGTLGSFYFQNFKVIPRNLYGIQILMGAELNILDASGSAGKRSGPPGLRHCQYPSPMLLRKNYFGKHLCLSGRIKKPLYPDYRTSG